MAKYKIRRKRDQLFLEEFFVGHGKTKERRHRWGPLNKATEFTAAQSMRHVHDLRCYNRAMQRNEVYERGEFNPA